VLDKTLTRFPDYRSYSAEVLAWRYRPGSERITLLLKSLKINIQKPQCQQGKGQGQGSKEKKFSKQTESQGRFCKVNINLKTENSKKDTSSNSEMKILCVKQQYTNNFAFHCKFTGTVWLKRIG
jgi:hypothetical protein